MSEPLSPEELEALRRLDTCAVANAIETFDVRLRNEGYADAQGGDVFVGTPPVMSSIPGNVEVRYANNLVIQNSTFAGLGAVALQKRSQTQSVSIIGNKFYDISHNAITAGFRNEATSLNNILKNITIKKNLIKNIGVDYRSSVAINLLDADVTVDHNEIFDIPYSGITITMLGHIKVTNNLIYDEVLYASDGGGIYNNGTYTSVEIANNYVHHTGVYYGSIYLDDNSQFVSVHDNVIRNTYYGLIITGNNNILMNNYMDSGIFHVSGSNTEAGNPIISNGVWPSDALSIMNNAGLEPAYQYLRTSVDSGQIPSSQMTATATSQETSQAKNSASNVLDGYVSTKWRTE